MSMSGKLEFLLRVKVIAEILMGFRMMHHHSFDHFAVVQISSFSIFIESAFSRL